MHFKRTLIASAILCGQVGLAQAGGYVETLPAAAGWPSGKVARAQAGGFVEGSKATLTLRNYYFDRDFRSNNPNLPARINDVSQSQAWAQGLILRMESGFTEGPVGFGLNVLGTAGFKLDGGPGRTLLGNDLLPSDPVTNEPGDNYSELGLTAKAKISATELQVGTLSPTLPVLLSVPTRLFTPTFRGAYLRSDELDNLTLHLGHIDRMNVRNSSNYEPLRVNGPYGRFNEAAESNRFDFTGLDYRWSDSLVTSYNYAQLKEIYQQHYFGLVHTLPLSEGSKLKTDLRYFNSREDGEARAGKVDNQSLGLRFNWLTGPHSLMVGYMQQSGDSAQPFIYRTDVHVHSELAMTSDFVNPDERTLGVRYDYDFVALGVPGLRGMLRYIHGDNIELPGVDHRASEIERGVELAYVVQSGSLKNLGLRWRYASNRNDYFRDIDETRINIDYTLALW
ncbi:OprD family porin [Pseudomonas sp. MAP12]|uniref:OprD family porin n=1 Tax=Geopseudomonas aromaticivorans TaxID=2849492 RepID=A0ABS6N0V4_9GAMM|nr:OprD family porin [Pseudomonas aromaticivorans]MBV2134680.1 OprD family porin [Pseudomonas aromaticivorans]